jgi:putative transposase
MTKRKSDDRDTSERWAPLRFAVVGPLLAAPPVKGQLDAEITALTHKQWRHPHTGAPIRFGFSTIERWYYRSRNATRDPVGVLRRAVRKDRGQSQLSEGLKAAVQAQWQQHKGWSYQLHFDNLLVQAKKNPALGPLPSYSTLRRHMKSHGLIKTQRLGPRGRPSVEAAEARLEQREVRSYEAQYVQGLWHLDFHHGSRKVLTAQGEWKKPLLLAVMDDRSRLCCHAQWYLHETEEELIHGLCQALQKRGLPRSLMTDNGSAMRAAETQQGLLRLGILLEMTLAYSPYQNGKQENFWTRVEGRLMAMLENLDTLSLGKLNEATLAWVELEYNRQLHSETKQTPIDRFLDGPTVGRPCPAWAALQESFTLEESRTQRRSDGTITVGGVRFEVPGPYRTLQQVRIRYARWDLSYVLLWDPQNQTILCHLYPLDKTKNAEGRRRPVRSLSDSPQVRPPAHAPPIAPLLEQLMQDYADTGLPPAYLPKDDLETAPIPSKESTP